MEQSTETNDEKHGDGVDGDDVNTDWLYISPSCDSELLDALSEEDGGDEQENEAGQREDVGAGRGVEMVGIIGHWSSLHQTLQLGYHHSVIERQGWCRRRTSLLKEAKLARPRFQCSWS